jgi:hypothetical protein
MTLSCRVQRHGDDRIPSLQGKHRLGSRYQQVGEERLKPERPLVFVTVKDFENLIFRCDS